MRIIVLTLLILVSTTTLCPAQAMTPPTNTATSSAGFWNPVVNDFREELIPSDASEIQMEQPDMKKKREEEEKKIEALKLAAPGGAVPAATAAPLDEATARKLTERFGNDADTQNILSKYGDPRETPKVHADEKAPAPVKAFVEAYNSGNKQLAFAFARQYARYTNELKEHASEFTRNVVTAQAEEGLLPPNNFQDRPEYRVDKSIVEESRKFIEEDLAGKEPELNDEAKAILDEALKAENADADAKNFSYAKDMAPGADTPGKQDRASTRREFAGRLPAMGTKKVNAVFVFRAQDPKSHEVAAALERMSVERLGSANLGIVGVSPDMLTEEQTAVFKKITGANFQLTDNKELLKGLQVNAVPAVVFTNSNADVLHMEIGRKSYERLDEVMRIMEGR